MPVVSIIIPIKKINKKRHKSLLSSINKQSFKDFETLVISDKILSAGPAQKRDLAVTKAKGDIVAFIDDDAYPAKHWLTNATPYFNNKNIAAVCGPGITPPNNNLRQQVSGWVWQSSLGAGGAGTYRNTQAQKRYVDDYPTFNLIVRKKDFLQVGGFDSHFWPGEDTKLCHDLVYKLNKKIIYDPKILVYHHRRPIFKAHLKQISRFGLHRGFFVKILPKTSKKINYFIPLLLVLGLILGPIFYLTLISLNYLFLANIMLNCWFISITIYLALLILTGLWAGIKSKNWKIGVLLIPAIFLSHLIYGLFFAFGLTSRNLRQ